MSRISYQSQLKLLDLHDSTVGGMLSNIVGIHIPVYIELAFAYLMITCNISFIGHLNNPAMVAGMGLACLYINLVCQSIYVGFNYLIGTLSS